MNQLGKEATPFFFITNFELSENVVVPAAEMETTPLRFCIDGKPEKLSIDLNFNKSPVSFDRYKAAFDTVQEELHNGNSYIVNLTFPSEISINLSFNEIFEYSKAKYKLLWKDKFVVFSPETFIKIHKGRITSHPMKGTIRADIPAAKEKLLNSVKEAAEHASIVDLIRNDLSIKAQDVQVSRFKYLDLVNTGKGQIWQMSSEISANVCPGYPGNIGDLILSMLPAGSISGAPKQKTLEIIKKAEQYDRGFYCGVAGYFDGENLESFVLIRFIEQIDGKYFYKSGGGIHSLSQLEEEYQELIDKIYVPVS